MNINTAASICYGRQVQQDCEDEMDRRQREHDEREERIAEIYATIPDDYRESLILETVSEFSAVDPQFDVTCFDLYKQATTTQKPEDYQSLGVAFASWINHYRRKVAEQEADK